MCWQEIGLVKAPNGSPFKIHDDAKQTSELQKPAAEAIRAVKKDGFAEQGLINGAGADLCTPPPLLVVNLVHFL